MEPQDDYLPEALLSRLVDYETATVISQMIYPPKPTLVVNGEKPRPGMEVTLVPVTYIRQPEFWEIRVVGSPGDLGGPPVATQLPAEPPHATQLPAEPPVATQLPAEPPHATQLPAEPPHATQLPAEPPVATQLAAEPPVPTQLPAEPPVATQLPAETTAYSVQLDLAACTGTLGIEVIGANQTERILVASAEPVEE